MAVRVDGRDKPGHDESRVWAGRRHDKLIPGDWKQKTGDLTTGAPAAAAPLRHAFPSGNPKA